MTSIQTISKVIATILITPISISYAQEINRGEYSDIFSSNTNYKGNTNCRTTTSTQILSCLGLRCKPTHEGGCTQSEYTAELIQTSCTNPGAGTGSETAAKICYYDTICCPIEINDSSSLNSLTIMETTKNNNNNNVNDNEWPDEPQMYTSSTYTSLSTTQSEDGGSIGAGLGFAIMFMIGAVLYIVVARIKKQREQNNQKNSVSSSSSGGVNGFLEDGNNVELPKKKKKSQRTIYDIDSSSSSGGSNSRRSDPPSSSSSSRNSGSRNSRGGGSRTNQSRKSGTSRHSRKSRQSKNTVDRYLEKQAKDMEALGISSRSSDESNSILS